MESNTLAEYLIIWDPGLMEVINSSPLRDTFPTQSSMEVYGPMYVTDIANQALH